MHPQLSVIIPTFNRISILRESLGILFSSSKGTELEVIVVNDGDQRLDELRKEYPAIKIITNSGSGVASARNIGGNHSLADIILFMDDDMWMTEEAIQRILQFHTDNDGQVLNLNWVYPEKLRNQLKGTVFGRYLIQYGFTSLKGWSKDTLEWIDECVFKSSGVTSQNLSMRRAIFKSSGGYNESFPYAGFEDYEYSKKLNSCGIEIFIDPNVFTYHNEADRIFIDSWLNRKFRGSVTRKVAVKMGYNELSLDYSVFKRIIFLGVRILAPLMKKFVSSNLLNRTYASDRLSFFIINILLAESIYRGYTFKKD